MQGLPKIYFFETEDWEKEYISKSPLGKLAPRLFTDELIISNASLAQEAEIISVFIYSRINEAILQSLPHLKIIATRSTGFDHIDINACKKHNIKVCNVPFYGENTVAEHTFALILSLSRNIHKAYVKTVKSDFSLEGLKGFDLKDKTLGVIGAGHIGLHVIKMARGFGMRALAYDVNKNHFLEEVLGFKYVSLEELLASSDIISLHAPYNEKTHHLINKENIKLIKRGAILINTARGGLVDTDALVYALDDGILSGCGLDVLEGEELIKEEKQIISGNFPKEKLETLVKNHILIHRENVVITPHIAFYSQEALIRIIETTVTNILNCIEGKLVNTVC